MTCKNVVIYTLFVFAGLSQLPEMAVLAADSTNVDEEVRLLRGQNALLQQQVQKQGTALDTLAKKVQALEAAGDDRAVTEGENPPAAQGGLNFGKVDLGAEGGVGFFKTGSQGYAPDSEFRVDEARIFLEAPVWNNVYFYSDIDLATHEDPTLSTQLGELYLDFEDVSQLWGKDGQLNVRTGRMFIPFGEEYLNRYAMENPLISHSLSDIWGISPGVELYGTLGKFSYATAVQNGGYDGVQDFDDDKSVAGRVSYDPGPHWHFSLSGMRTGNLSAQNDMSSILWFSEGFFQSIGSPATTKFYADLVEADATARWKSGHVSLLGGYARYGDNDPTADNSRNIFYYSIEAQQKLTKNFYAAARFSEIFANQGYPLVGLGNYNNYYELLTTRIWRASLGLGYRFSDNLALKAEYSFERGEEVNGDPRGDEDFLGTEAVFKF